MAMNFAYQPASDLYGCILMAISPTRNLCNKLLHMISTPNPKLWGFCSVNSIEWGCSRNLLLTCPVEICSLRHVTKWGMIRLIFESNIHGFNSPGGTIEERRHRSLWKACGAIPELCFRNLPGLSTTAGLGKRCQSGCVSRSFSEHPEAAGSEPVPGMAKTYDYQSLPG
jgi:hypothetical protein